MRWLQLVREYEGRKGREAAHIHPTPIMRVKKDFVLASSNVNQTDVGDMS